MTVLAALLGIRKQPLEFEKVALCALLKNIDAAAHQAATSDLNLLRKPTERQAAAGVYKKGHYKLLGMKISIENPAGSRRKPTWPVLQAHYGYIRGTVGADGGSIDIFVRQGTDDSWKGLIYVIDQYVNDKFNEHKVMIGWDDERSAKQSYLSAYEKGWGGLHACTAVDISTFKRWLKTGDTSAEFSVQIENFKE
jgi:hypothetical protein